MQPLSWMVVLQAARPTIRARIRGSFRIVGNLPILTTRKSEPLHYLQQMKSPEIINTEILSNNWYVLRKYTYRFQQNGEWVTRQREAYDRGNGAAILLYNRQQGTVILTRQFR